MTTVILERKKEISREFQEALNALSLGFEKLQPRIERVFTIGKAEGMNDKEIGKAIRKKLRGHYGHSTIWKVFKNHPDARQKQNHKKRNYPKIKTDRYRNYQEIIATKNKLLKEKDEQIKGLQRQLSEANKKIVQLEKKIRYEEIPLKQ